MKRLWGGLVLATFVLTLAGCRNTCRPGCQTQPVPPPSRRPVLQPPPVFPGPVPPGAVVPPPANLPPQAPPGSPYPPVPPSPPAAAFPPVPPAPPPTNSFSTPPATSGTAPAPTVPRWTPVDPGVQLGAPEPFAGADARSDPRLYPPGKSDDSAAGQGLPVGIPQFASPMDHVATGLRPALDGGLDWLQARGYRTVVHLRAPTENDDADKKQVEKRGMKYVSLEVGPLTLTRETVEAFNRLVCDAAARPIFFYDRDGSRGGAMWYLYYRTSEQFADDVARIRARALGLREDRDGDHRDMWLAVQKYLAESVR